MVRTKKQEKLLGKTQSLWRNLIGNAHVFTKEKLAILSKYSARELESARFSSIIRKWAKRHTMAAIADPTEDILFEISRLGRDTELPGRIFRSFEYWLSKNKQIFDIKAIRPAGPAETAKPAGAETVARSVKEKKKESVEMVTQSKPPILHIKKRKETRRSQIDRALVRMQYGLKAQADELPAEMSNPSGKETISGVKAADTVMADPRRQDVQDPAGKESAEKAPKTIKREIVLRGKKQQKASRFDVKVSAHVPAQNAHREKKWDEYEAAFLLSYALKVIAGEISKQEAVSTVSKKLRERAVAQGLVIDEIFRNENGISLQLGSMIDCYLGKDSWRTISKRFHETVELYKRDPDAIKRILQEGAAVEKPEATGGKYQDSTPQTSSAAEAGAFYAAAPAKVQQPLFRDPEEERYLAVLCERFQTGCRDGILGMKRFIRAYNEKYGTSLDDSDAAVRDAVEAKLHRIGICYNDRTFAAAALLSEAGKAKLFRYIEDTFAKGSPVLYYDALFAKFDSEWTAAREGITTVYLLREYLRHELAGAYHFSEPKYIAAARHAQIDIGQEVKDAMLAYGGPMQKTLLYQKLPHIPQDKIDIELHQPEYIYSNVGECFHVSLIDLSAAELAVIRGMIQRELDRCRFMGGRELVRMLQKEHPEIMDRFSSYRDISLRDAIGWYLGEDFSFQGNVISGKGQYLSARDVYTAFARTHDEFTLADLERVRDDFEFGNIYFYEVCCQALRISQDEFRAKSSAAFDVGRTDAAIDRFCAGPYIPLRAVTDFGYFPPAGYPWNSYLLEQYVFAYSRKYKLITNGFNAYASAGVIVRRDAGLSDMESIMADALAKSGVKLMKNDILQYLQDEGYIVRKRLSQNTLTAIINKARALQRSPRP